MRDMVFAILASTPDKLRQEAREMPLSAIKTRPAQDKWSVQEILAHIEDVEIPGFRERVEMILKEKNPFLAAFDQEARAIEKGYQRLDPWKSLDSFTRKRRENLKWLRQIKPAQWRRTGTHHTVGKMSAGEYLYEWAFHDLGHLRQIMEAKRYLLYPLMGNMRHYYKLS